MISRSPSSLICIYLFIFIIEMVTPNKKLSWNDKKGNWIATQK